jgi:hypothetical protein
MKDLITTVNSFIVQTRLLSLSQMKKVCSDIHQISYKKHYQNCDGGALLQNDTLDIPKSLSQ